MSTDTGSRMTKTSRPAPSARFAGLDGLRAIAVGLVVVYHLFPPAALPGGFIGVDVFFVISGFLITSLLLREHARTGTIRLGSFWKRRARRLLPALALVVTVCATAAWLIGGDVLVRLGAQVVGAFTFSYNWISIAGDTGYFGAAAPELFRNFWSLAVEEQFYVLWPLVLPLFLLLPRAWARMAAALVLAAASAAWMASVVLSGDITRAYFGTDTHAFGILLGVALAFALEARLRKAEPPPLPTISLAGGWTVVPPPAPRPSERVRATTGWVGTLALLGLLAVAFIPPTMTTATFPGAVLTATVLSTVAIAAAVWPGSAFGPAIDVSLLRWVGDRSYGIYLWHWPLLVLAVAALQGTGPEVGFSPWIGVGVLALTLVAAELSYRLLETPIRRLGFRGSLRALWGRLRGTPAMRLGAVASVAAGVLVIGGTSAAIAEAPSITSSEAVVAAGAEALASATPEPSATETPAPTGSPTATTTPTPTPSPPATPSPGEASGPLTAKPSPTPTTVAVTGSMISAVGDSVMLASAPALLERLPGIQVDAAVSRSTWAGPGILERLEAGGGLRPYVVLALGTNGPVNMASLEQMVEIAGARRTVVLVNAYAPRSWIAGVNADLAAFAKSTPNVVVADWSAAIGGQTQLLAGDRIHPGAAGGRVFADLVASTVQGIEQAKADRRYELELRLYENLQNRPLPVAE
jgi:peptidoglycan/LPS O-acetylase OafA/YrhL